MPSCDPDDLLTDWQRAFLEDVDGLEELTDAQEAKLAGIHDLVEQPRQGGDARAPSLKEEIDGHH